MTMHEAVKGATQADASRILDTEEPFSRLKGYLASINALTLREASTFPGDRDDAIRWLVADAWQMTVTAERLILGDPHDEETELETEHPTNGHA
jgi:hypothetical protein